MFNFKKHRDETVSIQKKLPAGNVTPIEYVHSKRFIQDGKDPLTFERERLSHTKADWLLREKRVPAIEADTNREIKEGQRQFIEHISSCYKIIDVENGELHSAYGMREIVEQEIAGYDKLYSELLENSKNSEKERGQRHEEQ